MVVAYFTDDSEALAHYGVKGMKWGVRRYRKKDGSLTSLGKKRQAYRDRIVNNTKDNIRRNELDKKQAKSAINDISKKGIASKYVTDLYYDDGDFQEGLMDVEDRGRDLWDDNKEAMRPLRTLSKTTQNEVVKRAKEHFSYDANYSSAKDRKIIKNIESTPIYKRSYAEAVRREHRADAGAAIVGGLLPIVGSVAISRATDQSVGKTIGNAATAALLVSPWTALGGALNAPKSASNYYDRHIADPSERRTRRR